MSCVLDFVVIVCVLPLAVPPGGSARPLTLILFCSALQSLLTVVQELGEGRVSRYRG